MDRVFLRGVNNKRSKPLAKENQGMEQRVRW